MLWSKLRVWVCGVLVTVMPFAWSAGAPAARAADAPTVTQVTPARGKTAGKNTVVLTGTGFEDVTKVQFGSKTGTKLKVTSATSLSVMAPPGYGTVDVRVVTKAGTSPVSADAKYRYVAAPKVTKVAAAAGGSGGRTTVTITGSNFVDVSKVVFGTTNGTEVTVTSEKSLTVVTPARKAGRVDVRVVTPYGTSAKSSKARFTFMTPPKISSVSPATGKTSGGTKVTIKGTGFTKLTGVTFASVAGTKLKASSTKKLTVTTPAGKAGFADVQVVGAYGSSAKATKAGFTYVAAPTISKLSPTNGPVKGGTKVTITGTDFTKVSKVTFGTKAGTKLSVKSKTSLTVTTPKQSAGTVDVRVTTSYGTSATIANARFAYGSAPTPPAAPTITGVAPTSGTTAGGTTVTITGTNLAGTSGVSVGGVPATDLSIVDSTTVTLRTPTHPPGIVDIVLTAPGGSVTFAQGFRFSNAPVVTSVKPPSGSTFGGQTVTITGEHLSGATEVDFGSTAADDLVVVSDSELKVTAPPAGLAGSVDVTVVGPDGVRSARTSSGQYLYVAPVIPDAVSKVVEPGHATEVSAGAGYAVTIPAEALQQAATVTVSPSQPVAGRPTVDVHIDGSWAGTVKVTLPLPEAPDGARPAVLHDAVDGMRLSSGSGISTGITDGVATVTADLTSLSPVSSDLIYCGAGQKGTFLCSDAHDQTYNMWSSQQATQDARFYLDEANHDDEACGVSVGTAYARGSLPFGMSCSTDLNGTLAEFKVNNDNHGTLAFWSAGALYHYERSGGESTTSSDSPNDVPIAMIPFLESLERNWILPGGALKVAKPLNSADTQLKLSGNVPATASYQGIIFLVSQIDEDVLKNGEAAAKLSTCVSGNLDDTTKNCIFSAVTAMLDYVKKHPEKFSKDVARNATALSILLKAADIGAYAASLTLAIPGAATKGTVTLGNTLLVEPPNNRAGNDYIARDPNTGRAVQVINGIPHLITTGDDFNCLAQSRYVWDNAALRALSLDPVGAVLTCSNTNRTAWDYRPQATGGNIPNNTILRDSAGHAWLINSSGQIQTIPDGGAYLCLSYNNPVVWNVPDAAIDSWTPIGVAPAGCGQSGTIPPAGSPAPSAVVHRYANAHFMERFGAGALTAAGALRLRCAELYNDDGTTRTGTRSYEVGRDGQTVTTDPCVTSIDDVTGRRFVKGADGWTAYNGSGDQIWRNRDIDAIFPTVDGENYPVITTMGWVGTIDPKTGIYDLPPFLPDGQGGPVQWATAANQELVASRAGWINWFNSRTGQVLRRIFKPNSPVVPSTGSSVLVLSSSWACQVTVSSESSAGVAWQATAELQAANCNANIWATSSGGGYLRIYTRTDDGKLQDRLWSFTSSGQMEDLGPLAQMYSTSRNYEVDPSLFTVDRSGRIAFIVEHWRGPCPVSDVVPSCSSFEVYVRDLDGQRRVAVFEPDDNGLIDTGQSVILFGLDQLWVVYAQNHDDNRFRPAGQVVIALPMASDGDFQVVRHFYE